MTIERSQISIQFVVLIICLFCLSLKAQADEPKRKGYSFFGIGLSLVDYEENSTVAIDGVVIDVETDTASIITQSSGAFTYVNPRWGFYLQTLSTLGVPKSSESWEHNDVIVQGNSVSFRFQRLALLGSRRLKQKQNHLLFGLQYGNFEYRRFGGRFTDAAEQIGVDESSFPTGTISETVWDVTALIGIERTNLFNTNKAGWQYQGRLLLGTPLMSSVVNTAVEDGRSFSNSFNGLEMQAQALIAYQFNPHFMIAASLEISANRRDAISTRTRAQNTDNAFPSTTFVSVLPSVSAHWSLK